MERVPEDAKFYLDETEAQSFITESNRFIMRAGEFHVQGLILNGCRHITNARVLDVGSGPGWITTALAKARKDWAMTGVDASPTMLKHAKNISLKAGLTVEWVQGFAQSTGLDAGAYDLVVSSLAFHEFPEAESVLKEFLRVLKQGGEIFIMDLLRPSSLGLVYYKGLSYLTSPFSVKFRRQFIQSLKSSYAFSEIKTAVDKLGLPYSLKKGFYVGTHYFVLQIKKP